MRQEPKVRWCAEGFIGAALNRGCGALHAPRESLLPFSIVRGCAASYCVNPDRSDKGSHPVMTFGGATERAGLADEFVGEVCGSWGKSKEVLMDAKGLAVRLRRDAAGAIDALIVAGLWLTLSTQALGQWLMAQLGAMRLSRARGQGTLEILIGMAVLGVLALAVWRLIGPALIARATGVATDLQTSGTGPMGTGN